MVDEASVQENNTDIAGVIAELERVAEAIRDGQEVHLFLGVAIQNGDKLNATGLFHGDVRAHLEIMPKLIETVMSRSVRIITRAERLALRVAKEKEEAAQACPVTPTT